MTLTVADLLDETMNGQPLGESGCTGVYGFPERFANLAPYALRNQRVGEPQQRFDNTTSLTPVKHLVRGMHVGQPLMDLACNPTIEVVLRQEGITLEQWLNKKIEAFQDAQTGDCSYDMVSMQANIALKELILRFAENGTNPFAHLFEQTWQLGLMKLTGDGDFSNILVNEKTARLEFVDQTQPDHMGYRPRQLGLHNIRWLKRDLLTLAKPSSLCDDEALQPLAERENALNKRIGKYIEDAYKKTKKRHASGACEPIAFAKTDSVEAVRLGDSPDTLAKQLDMLRTLALNNTIRR